MKMRGELSKQKSIVEQSIYRLDRWLVRNGWAGYDPYDLRGHPLFSHSKHELLLKNLRRTLLLTESFFPWAPRALLGISKKINPKAMGLLATGYLILYQTTHEGGYLERSQEALAWLEENSCKGYRGLCWGHPFGWQSKIRLPENTPTAVITAIVGEAYWRFYQITGEKRYLHRCQEICKFFLHDLHIDKISGDNICFSKTPLDHFHIHNGNLFVADFLLKVGKASQRKDYIDPAERAVSYTLGEQNEDGSISYWGKDQEDRIHLDHYHSGFEIRCLYSIWKTTGSEPVYFAFKRYYEFYCHKLFTPDGYPMMTPQSFYAINIHSCAEAILCHSTLAPDFPEAFRVLAQCVPWIIKTMQHPDGWFIYMVRKVQGRLDWKLKIPYIRWGQAWMLRALTEYDALLNENVDSQHAATQNGKLSSASPVLRPRPHDPIEAEGPR